MSCATCRAELPDGARFCPSCGTPLTPRTIDGERRLVTLLFADVVGSTRLAERLDPEVWAEIMQGGYDLMTAAVEAFGGSVNRYVGDAILALFGGDVAHEDDPERAVRAALAIQDRAADYSARLTAQLGIDFTVRIGLDTGLVVLARVGDRDSPEAMGDVANVAARLQALAAPGTILIGAETHRHVAHLVESAPTGEIAVKGRSAPVAAHKVVGLKAVRGSARGLAGLRSPLVGREREAARLDAALAALREGHGGLVTVIGDAGLGKSRLVADFRERVREGAPDVRWFEGRALSYAAATAYFPWQQIVRASIGARDATRPGELRALLRDHQARRGLPAEALPFLEGLLGAEGDGGRGEILALDAEARVAGLHDALSAHLRSLAAAAPTVVVFEDLHWADGPTVDALVKAAPAAASGRLLILCLLRPHGGHDDAGWRLVEHLRATAPEWATELVLAPLTGPQSVTLLANLLHVEDLPATVRERILARAEGNPFFLEEVIRELLDGGWVVEEGGFWRVVREVERVAIPDTLMGVLGARIDRLPEATRQVLQTAAVLGRSFAPDLLARVWSRDRAAGSGDDLAGHLDLLESEELLRKRTDAPETEYAFKHALTQEAAYERLLLKRRRELHRLAADVLATGGGDGPDHAALLAYHYERGEAWEPAAEFATLAGERAKSVFALDEALGHFTSALDALERLPEVAPSRFIDVTLQWNDASVQLRRHESLAPRQEMLSRLARAERLARELKDRRRLARVLVGRGTVLSLSGFPGEAYPALHEAHGMADELGDESLFLYPYFATTEALVDQDPRSALGHLEQVVALARKHHDPGIEAHALAAKAMAHSRLGQFRAAKATIEEALELAPHSRSLIKEADVHLTAGSVFYDMGQAEVGLRHSMIGLDKAIEGNGMECACAGYYYTGLGRLQEGASDAALEAFRGAAEVGRDLNTMQHFLNLVAAGRALVKLSSGDASALAELEASLANARKLKDEYGAAHVAHALGDAYTRAGDPGRGRELLSQALDYYRQRVMRPYVARVLRSLAAGHEAEGRDDEGRRLREEAEVLTRAADAPAAGPSPAAPPPGATADANVERP